MSAVVKQNNDYLKCGCAKCTHKSRKECIAGNCQCCNLEDAYSLATRVDFEW
ncbi:MAG TPA: hypothetical protein VFS46_02485 [Nitrososphaera sp.]|nr:hypothetical protein [Nitrososphaera sp.]